MARPRGRWTGPALLSTCPGDRRGSAVSPCGWAYGAATSGDGKACLAQPRCVAAEACGAAGGLGGTGGGTSAWGVVFVPFRRWFPSFTQIGASAPAFTASQQGSRPTRGSWGPVDWGQVRYAVPARLVPLVRCVCLCVRGRRGGAEDLSKAPDWVFPLLCSGEEPPGSGTRGETRLDPICVGRPSGPGEAHGAGAPGPVGGSFRKGRGLPCRPTLVGDL